MELWQELQDFHVLFTFLLLVPFYSCVHTNAGSLLRGHSRLHSRCSIAHGAKKPDVGEVLPVEPSPSRVVAFVRVLSYDTPLRYCDLIFRIIDQVQVYFILHWKTCVHSLSTEHRHGLVWITRTPALWFTITSVTDFVGQMSSWETPGALSRLLVLSSGRRPFW